MVEVAPVPASGGNNKNIIIVLVSIVVIILLLITGYLFSKNQSLEKSVVDVKEQNTKIEKDLIFYKNTDLAKEVEILNFKLKDSDEKYEESKKKQSTAETNLNTLRQSLSTIPKVTTALSMMMKTFGKQPPDCYSASDKANIKQELTAVGDSALNNFWNEFISSTASENCSFSPNLLEKTINYGLGKISGITSK